MTTTTTAHADLAEQNYQRADLFRGAARVLPGADGRRAARAAARMERLAALQAYAAYAA